MNLFCKDDISVQSHFNNACKALHNLMVKLATQIRYQKCWMCEDLFFLCKDYFFFLLLTLLQLFLAMGSLITLKTCFHCIGYCHFESTSWVSHHFLLIALQTSVILLCLLLPIKLLCDVAIMHAIAQFSLDLRDFSLISQGVQEL